MPVKSYKKFLVLLVANALAKVFPQWPNPIKANVSLMFLTILEQSSLLRNLPPHKQLKKVKFIICLNCKVFTESAAKYRNIYCMQTP